VGFDLDMTLIDSRPAIMAAWRALATETGAQIDLEDINARLGVRLEDELSYWYAAADIAPAAAAYRRHYVQLAGASTSVMPGAHEALACVRAAGSSSAIITAKHEVSVTPCLDVTGLQADHIFTFVHGPQKADVLRRIGAAVYVGDTPADMTAAAEAGTRGLGVATGSYPPESLFEAGAVAVVTSLIDFPAWYTSLRATL
jgi:phosphoglycolate phosphatase